MDRIAALPCWQGRITLEPLKGGMSNESWKVTDANGAHVVRFGDDNAAHNILRWHEKAASRAAAAAGLSPSVQFEAPGILVIGFIEGRAFSEADMRAPANIARAARLIRAIHTLMLPLMRGPLLAFHPWQVNADYVARLADAGGRNAARLPALTAANDALAVMAGDPPFAFGHNDLLPANIIDDGERLWLIDWEYSGLNGIYFDLGGAASNAGMDDAQTTALLEAYFGRPATDADRRAIAVAQCQSLLRETLWSMTSEQHAAIDFDFAAYTEKNAERFDAAWRALNATA